MKLVTVAFAIFALAIVAFNVFKLDIFAVTTFILPVLDIIDCPFTNREPEKLMSPPTSSVYPGGVLMLMPTRRSLSIVIALS